MAEYIEREAVLEKLCSDCVDGCTRHCAEYTMLKYFPAADVRPVVRGKWIGNKRHQSCSECHMTYCVPDGQDGELDMTAYHFCPNCGADMREGN